MVGYVLKATKKRRRALGRNSLLLWLYFQTEVCFQTKEKRAQTRIYTQQTKGASPASIPCSACLDGSWPRLHRQLDEQLRASSSYSSPPIQRKLNRQAQMLLKGEPQFHCLNTVSGNRQRRSQYVFQYQLIFFGEHCRLVNHWVLPVINSCRQFDP